MKAIEEAEEDDYLEEENIVIDEGAHHDHVAFDDFDETDPLVDTNAWKTIISDDNRQTPPKKSRLSLGFSRATLYRHKSQEKDWNQRAETDVSQKKITDFCFVKIPVVVVVPPEQADIIDTDDEEVIPSNRRYRFSPFTEFELNTAINSLNLITKHFESQNVAEIERRKLTLQHAFRSYVLIQYFTLLKDGLTAEDAAKRVSDTYYSVLCPTATTLSYKARCIRRWGRLFIENNELIERKKGKHIKTKTIIMDEQFQSAFCALLRGIPVCKGRHRM